MFERIVVGVTDQATAKEAARRAQQLAVQLGAELHVVTAFGSQPGAADTAEQLLENLAMSSGANMQLHSHDGDPAAAICGVAKQVGADLVIVGNQGLGGAGKRSVSVPSEVSRQAPCSVLLLHTA